MYVDVLLNSPVCTAYPVRSQSFETQQPVVEITLA